MGRFRSFVHHFAGLLERHSTAGKGSWGNDVCFSHLNKQNFNSNFRRKFLHPFFGFNVLFTNHCHDPFYAKFLFGKIYSKVELI